MQPSSNLKNPTGWCLTPTLLLICSSFTRENGYPLLICSSRSAQHKNPSISKSRFTKLVAEVFFNQIFRIFRARFFHSPHLYTPIPSCKLTVRWLENSPKNFDGMKTRKDGDFHGRTVSLSEGTLQNFRKQKVYEFVVLPYLHL